MASREELVRLRAEALSRTRQAGKKISRNKVKNVFLAGSKYDPRKSAKQISRMNSIQLKSYTEKVNAFLSRKTQFVPTLMEPIPTALYQKYKRYERDYNAKAQVIKDMGRGHPRPGTNNDIPNDWVRNSESFLRNHPGVYRPIARESKYFFNEKALNTGIEDLKRRLTNRYVDEAVVGVKSNLEKMHVRSELYGHLTNEQLLHAWQYGTLADDAANYYKNKLGTYTGQQSPDIEAENNDNIDLMLASARLARNIVWAGTL